MNDREELNKDETFRLEQNFANLHLESEKWSLLLLLLFFQ